MKKKLLAVVVSIVMAACVYAQPNDDLPAAQKAAKDFGVRFKDVNDIEWGRAGNGLLVRFTMNGIKTRAGYDMHGKWLYNLKYYGEHHLPRDVRLMVKSVYYDYSILGVTEIEVNDGIAFLVHIMDDKSCKTIRVCDDTMDVLEDWKRIAEDFGR